MIDEKKMIHTQVYDDEHEEWIDKEMTIEEYLDAYTDEGCPESKLQPCEDAISRIAALDALRTNWANWGDYDDGYLAMKLTMDDLKKMPAVPKQRTGKWIKQKIGYGCSNCTLCTNDYGVGIYKFCPNCGAKMEGENNEA